MITINLSPSQYRVVHSAGECNRECSSAARASRMSQATATSATVPPAKTTTTLLPDTHPIYGIVNLALLTVLIYLLWANL